MSAGEYMRSKKVIRLVIFYWLPFVLYCSAIIYISHLSKPTGDYTFPINDKILHGLEYCVLIFLTLRAYRYSWLYDGRYRVLIISVLFCILFGASDEIHQYFISERECSFFDFGADVMGIIGGAFFFRRYALI